MTKTAVAGLNRPLTEVAMGYFRSRALAAAARLRVADAIGEGERSVDDLAVACACDGTALHRLLRALASFGVVAETRPGHFELTEYGRPLRKDAPDSEWPSVVFWGDLLADSWSRLADCVRSGERAEAVRPPGIPSRWSQDPEADAIFRAVMGTSPSVDYMPIARAWDFSRFRTVADLGGGGGALIAAILDAYPNLRGMLVDRQASIDAAEPRFQRDGLRERCDVVAADLMETVPTGADVYMLKHVLHGYPDEGAAAILRRCRHVVPERGRLLVIEFVLPDVVGHADADLEQRLMSDLNMLAVTGGRERSALDWQGLLSEAGFEMVGVTAVLGDLVSIVEAAPMPGRSP
jgi:O-methyltransferase domain